MKIEAKVVRRMFACFVVSGTDGTPFLSTAGDSPKDAIYNYERIMGERFEVAEERHGHTVRRLEIREPRA